MMARPKRKGGDGILSEPILPTEIWVALLGLSPRVLLDERLQSPDPHPIPPPSLVLPPNVQRRHLSPSQGLCLPALIRPSALLPPDHPARRVLSTPAPAEVLALQTLLLVLLRL